MDGGDNVHGNELVMGNIQQLIKLYSPDGAAFAFWVGADLSGQCRGTN